jgi:hypothetical protein
VVELPLRPIDLGGSQHWNYRRTALALAWGHFYLPAPVRAVRHVQPWAFHPGNKNIIKRLIMKNSGRGKQRQPILSLEFLGKQMENKYCLYDLKGADHGLR